MAKYGKSAEQRRDQINKKFEGVGNQYKDLRDAVADIWLCQGYVTHVAECIKFGNLNFFTSGKVGTDTYRAFEGKAKLLIAMLRTLQAAKLERPPPYSSAETIDRSILDGLGVKQQVPPLPPGGSASSLADWFSQLGLKKGAEKAGSGEQLTPIVESVNRNIVTYLRANAHSFPKALKPLVSEYEIDDRINKIDNRIKNIEAEITLINTKIATNFKILNTKFEEYREQLDFTVQNNVKRIDSLQTRINKVETNFASLSAQITTMREGIEDKFKEEIALVRSEHKQREKNLSTGQTIIVQHSPIQADEMHKKLQGEVAVLYAKVYALTLTQRLHLDLTEMLYTANNFSCAMALAVGTGFDQYQKNVDGANDNSLCVTMLQKGIGYICGKIPVVREAYELIGDAASGISKIVGKGNPAAETEWDPLDSPEQKTEISATDKKGGIAKLKEWAEKAKENKELQGSYITTGLQALKGVSRQSLSTEMHKAVTAKSEAFLKVYKKTILRLLDNDWVLEEVKHRAMGLPSHENAQQIGEDFIKVMLAEFSPLEYTNGIRASNKGFSIFSTSYIACITELYLYGLLREQSNNQPHERWGKIIDRLGIEYTTPSYELFQRRKPLGKGADANKIADGQTLIENPHKIPVPVEKGSKKRNRRAIAHAVLVALQRQISEKGWDAVYDSEIKSVEVIKNLLGVRVKAAMKFWYGSDFKTRRDDREPIKPGVIELYIEEIKRTTSFP